MQTVQIIVKVTDGLGYTLDEATSLEFNLPTTYDELDQQDILTPLNEHGQLVTLMAVRCKRAEDQLHSLIDEIK